MEKQNNNKGVIILLIIIIVILSTLCILLATETISFKNENINNQTNSNNQNNENIEENKSQNEIVDDKIDWGTYLLSIHLLDANVEKFKYDSNGIRTSEGIITLSKEDLTSVLTNLQKDKVIKYYTMGTDLVINSKLTISYEFHLYLKRYMTMNLKKY